MIVILDERVSVREGYVSCFAREGVAAIAIDTNEFVEWFEGIDHADVVAIEGFMIGKGCGLHLFPKLIVRRTPAPIISVVDERSLKETLAMFSAGVDDVVSKPIHVREILVRLTAVRERSARAVRPESRGEIQIFADGRDPIVGGAVMLLPRRERRILECLATNEGAWFTKGQIFRRVYGIFDDEFDESVIESHISRLRKRLREKLSTDPIESRRYLGYRLKGGLGALEGTELNAAASLTQANDGSLADKRVSAAEDDHERFRDNEDQRIRYVGAV